MSNLIYQSFNPQIHDVSKVAELVYDVDFRTFDLFYKDNKKAIKDIKKDLIRRKNNELFKVIINENNDITGIIECYTSKTGHSFNIKPLRLFLVDILDYFVLCDIKGDDFYIAEIAVDKNLRGSGIGRSVLNDAIAYAKAHDFRRVILDVDFRNPGAKSLYESLGFKVFNKKRVKIAGFERGMYNMELVF